MNIKTLSLQGSPYVGIFCSVTDDIALVPKYVTDKEVKTITETFDVEVVRTTIAETSLVGSMVRGLGKKMVVASTIEDIERAMLEKAGLELYTVKGLTAVGNLLCVQKHVGIASPLIPEEEIEGLSQFFGIPFHVRMIAETDIPGSCLIATEKGFLAHPKTVPEEMEWLEEQFKVPGMTTTANYGDPFIGNSIIANKKGIITGERTSGHELARIDEGLSPFLTNK